MAMRLLVNPVLIATTSNQKSVAMSLALYIKKSLFALEYVYKNLSWDVMYDWCKDALIQNLNTPYVIVIDNARFHKHKRIRLVKV